MNRRAKIAFFLLGLLLSVAVTGATVVLNEGKDAGENVVFEKANGPNVTVGETIEFTNENPWTTPNRIWLEPWGNFTSNGNTEVRVDTFNGTWTNVSSLDVTSAALTIDVNDKPPATISGDADSLRLRQSMGPDDDTTDFIYAGSSGTTTLTLNGLPANTQLAAVDVDTHNVLAVVTTDGSGQATFSGMPNSQHTVRLMTTKGAPSISDASPSGGEKLTQRQVTLEANVSDPDFPNDNATVEIYLDGSKIDTQYVTSNGTVSTTVEISSGGTHTWHLVVTDEYGQTTTSSTYQMVVPGTIFIRPVASPDELLNGTNVSVVGRFYSGDLVFERNTSTGKINMTGFPADRTYVLVIRSDGYYQRTTILTSLYDQQSVYLLNDSTTAYYTEFQLNDLTGKFSGENAETRLYIERPLNTSGSLEWQTVAGDYFDAGGTFESNLEENRRYRIRIVNNANNSRVLGAYTATRSRTVTLDVGEVTWEVEEPDTIQHMAEYQNLTDGNEAPNGQLIFRYEDPSMNTSRIRIIIHEDGNTSNELVDTNLTSGYGTLAYQKVITGAQMDTQWTIEWTAYNASGGVVASSTVPIAGQRFPIDNPFGSKWGPVALTAIFLFVAFLFGGRLSSLGALAVVGIAAVFWWLGMYTASGGVVLFAGLVAVAFAVGRGGRR